MIRNGNDKDPDSDPVLQNDTGESHSEREVIYSRGRKTSVKHAMQPHMLCIKGAFHHSNTSTSVYLGLLVKGELHCFYTSKSVCSSWGLLLHMWKKMSYALCGSAESLINLPQVMSHKLSRDGSED